MRAVVVMTSHTDKTFESLGSITQTCKHEHLIVVKRMRNGLMETVG